MFEKKASELMKKAQMIQVYGDVYNTERQNPDKIRIQRNTS